jgi:hypothetical protein
MQSVSSGVVNATVASSRNPGVKSFFAWDRSVQTATWFRLDESMLDSGDILTLTPYDNGVTPNEIISQADSFIYEDESANIISAEGIIEIYGDNNQSSLAEAYIVLEKFDQRYEK